MRIRLFSLFVSAAFVVSGQTPAAQTPTAPVPAPRVFEVASIRAAPPMNPMMAAQGKLRFGMKIDQARVEFSYMSLNDLIVSAYEVKPYQVTGPDWMKTERFDIVAKMPEGATKEQVPEMLRALLTDRFKVQIHHENKEHPIYAMVVARGGPKLKESPPDPAAPAEGAAPAPAAAGGFTVNSGGTAMQMKPGSDGKSMIMDGGAAGTTKMSMGADGNMHLETSKSTMANFAAMLSRFVDRPVEDMTGIKGNYQISLDLSMQDLRNVARSAGMNLPGGGPGGAAGGAAEAAPDPSGGSIFTTVQQMGLKLEPRKSAVDTIVVDRAEKTPTEN